MEVGVWERQAKDLGIFFLLFLEGTDSSPGLFQINLLSGGIWVDLLPQPLSSASSTSSDSHVLEVKDTLCQVPFPSSFSLAMGRQITEAGRVGK